MRISDWSSDVCSSDLILETISIAILAATRGRRPMFGAAARKDKAMIDIRKFDSLGHADHGWLDARHHFSFAGYQTGRASCREGVCQYVEISVVAGSLKKTIRTTQ